MRSPAPGVYEKSIRIGKSILEHLMASVRNEQPPVEVKGPDGMVVRARKGEVEIVVQVYSGEQLVGDLGGTTIHRS